MLGRRPRLGRRLGIDMVRTAVDDPADRAWLRALVWPDQPGRAATLDAALAVAAADPPKIRIGDAVRLLAPTLATLPGRDPAWVTHTVMLYQLDGAQRRALARALAAASRRRTVWEIGFEGEGGAGRGPGQDMVLRVTRYRAGRRRGTMRLATSDGHVTRIAWQPVGRWRKGRRVGAGGRAHRPQG